MPGTGDATDGLLTEGDENTNTDLNAFPSVPTNTELKKMKKVVHFLLGNSLFYNVIVSLLLICFAGPFVRNARRAT